MKVRRVRPAGGEEEATAQLASGNIPTQQDGLEIRRITSYLQELIEIAKEVDDESEESGHIRTG